MIPAINEAMLAVSSSLAASIVAKVTAITALALVAAWLARGSRAAVRHALLAAAFGVMLLLPIACVLMPPLHVGVPVEVDNRVSALPPFVSRADQRPPVGVANDPGDPVISVPRPSRISVSNLLLTGWIAGSAIFLLPVGIGLWQIRLLRRSGLPWRRGQSLADAIAREAGVRRRVEVLLQEGVPGPMTCGIVHPTIVLPRDAESWNEEDLGRAFVHELEHVRRGDSVSRFLARGACSLYWFHPLVWVAWRRLALEAERSCDDAVLKRSEATAYADQLVVLAKRLAAAQRSPLLAMANRADLATRVHAVLDARQRRGRAGALSLGLAITCAMALVIFMSSLILVAAPQSAPAQTVTPPRVDKVQDEPSDKKPDPPRLVTQAQPATGDRTVSAPSAVPAFEVASVRPSGPDSGFQIAGCSGDRFSSRGFRMVYLLIWAYDLQGEAANELYRSLPSTGMNAKSYDIQAKAGLPVTESECRLMVQALLVDRFKLRAHWESRNAEVSDLVVARGGPKFTKALDTDEGTDANLVIDGRPIMPPPGPSKGLTMGQLADRLTGHGAPGTLLEVADKTGLEGRYKIDLRFSTSLPADGQDPVDPPLDAALTRLGLRLEKHKGSVKMFVVDHLEPPDPDAN